MLSRPNASVEDAMSTMTANMFSEIMSDYIHNWEQNAEMAATNQTNSSRASPDSANPADGAKHITQSHTWPPLEVTNYSLDEWPNANIRPTCGQDTTKEVITQASSIATSVAAPLTPITCRDSHGFQASANSETEIHSGSDIHSQGHQPKYRTRRPQTSKPATEGNPLRYFVRIPPVAGPTTGPGNAERLTYTPDWKTSTATVPDSTITKAKKESQAIGEAFGNSWTQLTQVQSRERTTSTLYERMP